MSGWCPSSSVCGMAVACTAAVLPSAMVRLVPYSSHCSAGEYCCHVVHCALPGAWCVGGERVCAVRVVGYPLSAPPSSWWRVGPLWMVGRHSGWWVAWRGKGGCATDSPSCAWCPPSVRVAVPLSGGSGVLCVVPVFGSDPPSCIVLLPFALSVPSRIVPALLLFCVAVFVVGGEV